MGDDFHGGGAALSAPPLGGLGNFKGVMLCNRPSDDAPARASDSKAAYKSPFEHLGLPPCKRDDAPASAVKKRGPSAALRQHVRWLRELQDQMRGEREQVEEEEKQSEERKQRMRSAVERHRSAVKEMMAERDRAGDEQYQKEREAKVAARSAKAAPKEGQAKPKVAAKPLWAMTAKEKEDFEEDEAEHLIDFAENLDFDKFVGDLEFRHGLEALKDRAGRLQKEQDAFKDALVRDFNAKIDEEEGEGQSTSAGSPRSGVDGQSIFGDLKSEYSTGSSRRSAGQERYAARGLPDWDSSTNCGDEQRQVDAGLKTAAQAVLESAPQIRAVHSKESVQRIIERARDKTQIPPPADLYECMRRDGPMPVPVITSSEDTQQRLQKPVDPSQLPYLYRSPAI